MKKIVFITTHNWDTKRQGGFHKFAETTCKAGIETVFFSFPRPYYGLFMKREQLNKTVIKTLKKGKYYSLDESSNKLLNITFPTFRLPDSVGKFLRAKTMNWFLCHSFKSFKSFCKKYLSNTDCFVFESCEGVYFIDKLKKLFPNAKMIYRPSDPMVYASIPDRVKKMEANILYKADLNLIVNQEGIEAYKKSIPDFESKVKYELLSNGIDIKSYEKKYPEPELLQKENTILYVGAWEVEWPLLYKAAEINPDFNYIVVCPNYPSAQVLEEVKKINNLFYVPGIKPSEVPAWITNCSVVMVPYLTDFYKDRPLGITAKYYQAMAAGKPIVAYCDTPKLSEVGISATYKYEDFIKEIKKAIKRQSVQYEFDLKNREWSCITKQFIELIQEIQQ